MKVLFTKKTKNLVLADEEKNIFELDGNTFCDIYGNPVEFWKETHNREPHSNRDDSLEWWADWCADGGTTEQLLPVSVEEVEYGIDDIFGKIGFQNAKGDFVIEPQYAFAYCFSKGLAAVNLNRTFYTMADGFKTYENHFGYINERGETVIPLIYADAHPFNQYGVAVVWDKRKQFLIDLNGEMIPGTDSYGWNEWYDYEDRFVTIYGDSCEDDRGNEGLYDTKEKKVVIEPLYEEVYVYDDQRGIIKITDADTDGFGNYEYYEYFADSNGNVIFPWLKDKGFANVNVPDDMGLSIVTVSEYMESDLESDPRMTYPVNGKKYEKHFARGVYSSNEKVVIPLTYDMIKRLKLGMFACYRDEAVTVIQIEKEDC